MAQLTCEHLWLGYEGKPVIEDLSFSVQAGEYLCIVGANGSGKTTLMRTVLGLQKPLRGTVRFGDGLREGGIGYLPQRTPVQMDFPATVREVVLSGCQARLKLRPFYTRADKLLAEQNMEKMGVSALSKRCFRELSGGQQQRVLLARALCAARELLFLDEPVSGLDPDATADMYGLIRSLNREGVTIIMISHDLAAAERDASHILSVGETVFCGTLAEWLEKKGGEQA